MSRYIDADITVRTICGIKCGCERNECGHDIPCQQVQILETSQTADVVPMDFHDKCMRIEIEKRVGMVEVVRCKDCKYWNERDRLCNDLMGFGRHWHDNDYCNYGKRKSNDN